MKLIRHIEFCGSLLTLVLLNGCGEIPSKEKVVIETACEPGQVLSSAALNALVRSAERGDIEAVRGLIYYYSSNGDAARHNFWELSLAKMGDQPAIASIALKSWMDAKRLHDSDRTKLDLLLRSKIFYDKLDAKSREDENTIRLYGRVSGDIERLVKKHNITISQWSARLIALQKVEDQKLSFAELGVGSGPNGGC